MDQPNRNERLGRRLLVLRVAGLGTVAAVGAQASAGPLPGPAAPVAAPAAPVERVRTDNDPSDAPGYGRRGYGGGRTDSDPRDSPGSGRGYSYAPQRRSVTDNDPSDGQGQGRGYAPPRRSVTDNDPSDGQGRGRGWR
ncbi:hypothetical protein QWZ14_17420 [Paeniroseomonas aquatica]|uniref:Translation initiation factor IF-2 n=1 Tax=Paeniroseomonas aquatica TaxID=373043 RepID=A0ABT8A8U3_9PROT|nr:hypothetical protein [Paeniroseomonas aquatica]MDN3566151.1 hypothetical protein [Paeniroseomonas aquatica]